MNLCVVWNSAEPKKKQKNKNNNNNKKKTFL